LYFRKNNNFQHYYTTVNHVLDSTIGPTFDTTDNSSAIVYWIYDQVFFLNLLSYCY